MKDKKKLDPKTEKTVEGITQIVVVALGVVGAYYLAVFAEWIEPLF